jgi:hypothetical protein
VSYFKLYEDPTYDKDGQLVDEDDSDEGDWQDDIPPHTDIYSPHATVNS